MKLNEETAIEIFLVLGTAAVWALMILFIFPLIPVNPVNRVLFESWCIGGVVLIPLSLYAISIKNDLPYTSISNQRIEISTDKLDQTEHAMLCAFIQNLGFIAKQQYTSLGLYGGEFRYIIIYDGDLWNKNKKKIEKKYHKLLNKIYFDDISQNFGETEQNPVFNIREDLKGGAAR